MYKFTYNELRAISSEELSLLKEKAKSGDSMAICKMVLCILYAQADGSKDEIQKYLTPAVAAKDEMALLLQGYTYEHAIGTSKNYAKAVDCYSKAYDLLNKIHSSDKELKDGAKALQELEAEYDNLTKRIAQIVTIKKFCQFKDGKFHFLWNSETREGLGKLLPKISQDVAEFGELYAKAITKLNVEEQGKWEFRYQDTLLMPLEMIKALAARDYFESFLKENALQVFPADTYFNNALGRCLIDDDDAHDNDYIISGLLNMAGHEGDALWQYRAGLWYEYCDNNLEPKTAEYWYEQSKNGIPAAKIALERVKGSLQYRLLDNLREGTAKECQTLMNRSSKNPQNGVSWLIECALRGDESALQRLERNHFTPKGENFVYYSKFISESTKPYYSLLKEEAYADKEANKEWFSKMLKDKEAYYKRILDEERRKAEEERRREEAIRKAKEAEEAKRRAEEEARRKAEEERIRKEEEAKRRAEEAKRRAEEEAKRKAEEEARRKAEEEKKRLNAQRKYAEQCHSLIRDIKSIGFKIEVLVSQWQNALLAEFNPLVDNLAEAERVCGEKLNTYKRKWWQVPFYQKEVVDPDELFEEECRKAQKKVTRFKEIDKDFNSVSAKLEELMHISDIENDKKLLEERLKDLQIYKDTLSDKTKEGLSIFKSLKSQIENLKNGKSMHLCAPTFDLFRSITSLGILIIVLNLVLVLFFGFWEYSLLITFGLATIGISEMFDLEWSKKRSFITGAIVALIILFFIPSKESPSQPDDSKSSEKVMNNFTNNSESEVVSEDSVISAAESRYDYVYSAEDNGWIQVELNDKKGFIDKNGKEIVPPKYDFIYGDEDNGWRKVELNDKKGFIDKNGKEIVPPKYDYIYSADDNGWRKVELNGKKGFIDKNGKEIVHPEYDYIYSWSGGLLKVEKNGKKGYVNREGKLVQPME